MEIHDQACTTSLYQNIESIQCNAPLQTLDAVSRHFREKLYQELIIESLQQSPCCLFEIIKNQSPN